MGLPAIGCRLWALAPQASIRTPVVRYGCLRPRFSHSPFLPLLLVCLFLPASASAQSESILVTPETRKTPRGALWRAAAVPGWGQIYNEQYIKLPFVYGGLAGFTAGAIHFTSRHRRWDRAFRYIRAEELIDAGNLDENPCPSCLTEYNLVLAEINLNSVSSSAIRGNRDIFRRNRDLLYVGVGLWYGLTVLDAFVSAHLLDFDVGEDLTVALYPHPHGLAATLHWGH